MAGGVGVCHPTPCSKLPITEGPTREGTAAQDKARVSGPSFTRQKLPPATNADSSKVLIMVLPWMCVCLVPAKLRFYKWTYQPEKRKKCVQGGDFPKVQWNKGLESKYFFFHFLPPIIMEVH